MPRQRLAFERAPAEIVGIALHDPIPSGRIARRQQFGRAQSIAERSPALSSAAELRASMARLPRFLVQRHALRTGGFGENTHAQTADFPVASSETWSITANPTEVVPMSGPNTSCMQVVHHCFLRAACQHHAAANRSFARARCLGIVHRHPKPPPQGGGFSLLHASNFGHNTRVASSSGDGVERLRGTRNPREQVKAVFGQGIWVLPAGRRKRRNVDPAAISERRPRANSTHLRALIGTP